MYGPLELIDYPRIDETGRIAVEKASEKYKIDPVTVITFYNHKTIEDGFKNNQISRIGTIEAKSHILSRYLSYITDLRFSLPVELSMLSERIVTGLSTIENYKLKAYLFVDEHDYYENMNRSKLDFKNNLLTICEIREPVKEPRYFLNENKELPQIFKKLKLDKKYDVPNSDIIDNCDKSALEMYKSYFKGFWTKDKPFYSGDYNYVFKKLKSYYGGKGITPKVIKKFIDRTVSALSYGYDVSEEKNNKNSTEYIS